MDYSSTKEEEIVIAEWIKEVSGWEEEYLNNTDNKLSDREKQILSGDPIKSNEGMIYGRMYADWKKRKGYKVEENVKPVNSSEDSSE